MSFGFRPRWPSVLAGVLAAGLLLVVAGCSGVTPLGPDAAATMPAPHPLRSPFVLQAMRAQPASPAGGCPAGYVTLAGNNGWCYRKIGTPVTFTSAAVSPVTVEKPNPPPGQQAGPAHYAFTLTLPASDVPALTAVTTTAAGVQGPLALSADGQTWVLPMVVGAFTSRQFLVPLPSKNQALQLQRILAPSA
jgi:hypothetical protein